jgi:hypothetical protein
MMYEIWNNDGPMRVYYCKKTRSVLDSSKVPELLSEYENLPTSPNDCYGCGISPLK